MFTLDPIHPLYTAILEAVSASPNISIGELLKELHRKKVNITLQHLYRTIHRMVEAQILVKSGTTVSVNVMWLTYIQFFAERGKKTLMNTSIQQVFPLKPGKKVTFKVMTLLELQTLWHHLLVQVHQAVPKKHLLKYYSHAWWQIGKHALDIDFYRRITEGGIQCHWLFGNTTFLDQHAVKIHKDLMDSRLTDNPPFPREGYALNIYGSYIFECVIPERLSKHLDFVFHTVTSEDMFDPEIYEDIFTLREPMTLRVWNNEKQSTILRKKFAPFFLYS